MFSQFIFATSSDEINYGTCDTTDLRTVQKCIDKIALEKFEEYNLPNEAIVARSKNNRHVLFSILAQYTDEYPYGKKMRSNIPKVESSEFVALIAVYEDELKLIYLTVQENGKVDFINDLNVVDLEPNHLICQESKRDPSQFYFKSNKASAALTEIIADLFSEYGSCTYNN